LGRGRRPFDVRLPDLGTGLDDILQGFLLEVRGTLDRRHQVRDEVRPSLIDVLYLPPGRIHPFLEADEVVVNAAHHQRDQNNQPEGRETTSDQCFAHFPSREFRSLSGTRARLASESSRNRDSESGIDRSQARHHR